MFLFCSILDSLSEKSDSAVNKKDWLMPERGIYAQGMVSYAGTKFDIFWFRKQG